MDLDMLGHSQVPETDIRTYMRQAQEALMHQNCKCGLRALGKDFNHKQMLAKTDN